MPRMHNYSTHLPLLSAAVHIFGGPVLEFGCGLYSTPVLCQMLKGERFLSLEQDFDWYEETRKKGWFIDPNHALEFAGQFWQTAAEKAIAEAKGRGQRWPLVFMDLSPVKERAGIIQLMQEYASVVVAHDSEHPIYNYEPTFARFKSRYDYKALTPWTTAVSDRFDLPASFERGEAVHL